MISINSNHRTSALFTSESVTMGHPDKIADQISDAVLDAMIAQDKHSRVACETMVKSSMVLVAGEITSKAKVSIPDIARRTIKDIGYTDPDMGFDYQTCAVLTNIDPVCADASSGIRVVRGGCFATVDPSLLRCSSRLASPTAHVQPHCGFRVVVRP